MDFCCDKCLVLFVCMPDGVVGKQVTFQKSKGFQIAVFVYPLFVYSSKYKNNKECDYCR